MLPVRPDGPGKPWLIVHNVSQCHVYATTQLGTNCIWDKLTHRVFVTFSLVTHPSTLSARRWLVKTVKSGRCHSTLSPIIDGVFLSKGSTIFHNTRTWWDLHWTFYTICRLLCKCPGITIWGIDQLIIRWIFFFQQNWCKIIFSQYDYSYIVF